MIINIVKETTKDLVALGQGFGTAVKEEVELYFEQKKHVAEDMASDAKETIKESKVYEKFEDIEQKVKATIEKSLANFNSDKAGDKERLEKRIASLEAKLAKLVDGMEETKKAKK